MATAGFSIGLGNIWRFPSLTGASGGGAFVVVYVLIAIGIGIPLLTAEIALGRAAQANPLAGMRSRTARGSPWVLLAWTGLVAGFLILTYYVVILGWVLAYTLETLRGRFLGISPQAAAEAYQHFVSRPVPVAGYTALTLLMTGLVVVQGLRRGIEATARWLLPALFVMLIGLAVGALTLPGALAGVRWYLTPDWESINGRVVLAALGQAFFSIGVGLMSAFVYGSYLRPGADAVPAGAALVVGFDTLAALLAGFVIFPAVFSYGMSPDGGPGLLFVTLTSVFARAPAGQFVGGAFFLLVFIAGFTSAIAMVETVAMTTGETLGITRGRALGAVLTALFLGGLPTILGFGPWRSVQIAGYDIFGLVDFAANSVLLPLGALLLALYITHRWGFDAFREEANAGAGRIRVTGRWRPLLAVVVPVGLLFILLSNLGLFG